MFSQLTSRYSTLSLTTASTMALTAACCGGIYGYFEASERVALHHRTSYTDVYIAEEKISYSVSKGGSAHENYQVTGVTPDGIGHVFKNYDSWVSGKTNQQEIKDKIQQGAICDITAYGWSRWQYENIVEARCRLDSIK